MNQQDTPLFSALVKHAAAAPIQFHIPGHKQGVGVDPEFGEYMGKNALAIDLINIQPLDDLHQPTGIIDQAQRLAADTFGADHTFFSVQGTSGAIMAMIMSVCSEGDKIIVPRNAHKSIFSAIIFSGAIPIFIPPVRDEKLGIEHGVTIESVRKIVKQHRDAKAVLLINPTYFGICANLAEIIELVHSYDIPVLVDEAHGTLMHFHDGLPLSAMEAGADMAATSVHKQGGAMTQSSILNVKEGRVNVKKVQTMMSMLTTTSTSYLLLASLDTTRRQLALRGREMAAEAIQLANYAREEINAIAGLYCFGQERVGTDGVFAHDPTKLCIYVRDLGITGLEAEHWLRVNCNIEVELSDMNNILCLITLGDTQLNVDFLLHALRHMSEWFRHRSSADQQDAATLPAAPKLRLPPRQAFQAETETLPIHETEGKVIAEFIYAYPPGIPILIPGEEITREQIQYIVDHRDAGLPVKGPEDPSIRYLKVVANAMICMD